MGAADDLLSSYQHVIDTLTFETGSKGVFDVDVDGDPLFSKRSAGRHAEPGEVLRLFRDTYAADVTPYGE